MCWVGELDATAWNANTNIGCANSAKTCDNVMRCPKRTWRHHRNVNRQFAHFRSEHQPPCLNLPCSEATHGVNSAMLSQTLLT